MKFTQKELASLKRAAEILDEHEYEILAEQIWFVHGVNSAKEK